MIVPLTNFSTTPKPSCSSQNRLKDSDVTWLYGPLHEHADPVPPPKQATTADKLDLDEGGGVRSILKHRTISDLLTTPGRAGSPGVETGFALDEDEAEESDEPQPERSRSQLFSVRSDSNLVGKNTTRKSGSPHQVIESSTAEPVHPPIGRTESSNSEEKRHISFNQRVEQCIAVDRDYPDYDDYSEDESDDADGDETSDEEEVLTMRSSPHTSSSYTSKASSNEFPIIAKLAPTRLKTSETYPSPSPAVVDPTGFMNSMESSTASVSAYPQNYGHARTTHPGPAAEANARSAQWDVDDDDFNGDFDYFNGPDLSDGHGDHIQDGPAFNTGDAASSPDATRSYTSYFDHSESDRADGSSASSSPQQDYNSAPEDPSQPAATVGPRGILKRRHVHQSNDYGSSADSSLDVLGTSQADGSGSFSDNYENSGREPCERGRTSQRLGSSASYERIQEAARSSRTRSGSGGSSFSHSPNGSGANGVNDDRYGASPSTSPNAPRGAYMGGDSDGKREGAFRGKEASREGIEKAKVGRGGDTDAYDLDDPRSSKDYGDERSYWADDKPSKGSPGKAPGTPSRTHAATAKTTTAAATAGGAELSVDTENVPSNSPSLGGDPSGFGSIEVGPTPLNTPTFLLSRASGKRRSASNASMDSTGPTSPTLPRRQSATGALVAPGVSEPRVPLAHDYVEEDEGGLVGRAVEIVNTARDLIGALLGTGDRGRSWREG